MPVQQKLSGHFSLINSENEFLMVFNPEIETDLNQ